MSANKRYFYYKTTLFAILSLLITNIAHADDASNILLPTVAGAAIGGAAGGGKGAAIGAGVGLFTGAMVNAGSNNNKKHRRSRNYDNELNSLRDENKDLIQENKSLSREIRRLEEDNDQLRKENARLKAAQLKTTKPSRYNNKKKKYNPETIVTKKSEEDTTESIAEPNNENLSESKEISKEKDLTKKLSPAETE
ncbi:hypothetical protein EKK58_06890 [Candidatus Dependentiae bacterium]|nr:MAG: hypothetical protein EKK58_06890 [Candidatus Dependentiae bacterium]